MRALVSLLGVVALLIGFAPAATAFSDSFDSDTTASYGLVQTDPSRGTGQLVYDAAGLRAQVLTGDDIGVIISRADISPRESGSFDFSFLPTVKYPKGGILMVRLMQDASNYYQLRNTNGYGAGEFEKVVGGQVVESIALPSGYRQGAPYAVSIGFSADLATLDAFGATLALSHDTTPLTVARFEIELFQQDAYLDDIVYDAPVDPPPVADAGPDQAAASGDPVTLDASGSSDLGGAIVSYAWTQLSGPGVALSDGGAVAPSFTAPDLGGANASLVFELTVTDDAGQTASDTVQVDVWGSLEFADFFGTDTTGEYGVQLIYPAQGTAQLVYDAAGQRAQVLAGNDFGLILSRDLPPRTSGSFSVDLLPTAKYPSGGTVAVRLMQDAANYYEVRNTDGYGPGALIKVVDGQTVDSVSFPSGYVQGVAQTISVGFAPDLTTLKAFGALLTLSQDATPLTVTRLEVELFQQDAYLDNVFYGDAIDWPPVADAGPDQVVLPLALVTLDGAGSHDPEGALASYHWEQLSGPAVTLSDAAAPRPTFSAPDPNGSNLSLQFELTVTDSAGQTATDTVWIEVWGSSTFADSFGSDTTTSYDLTRLDPERGTAQFAYDAVGQRAQFVTGNDFGLVISHDVPPRSSGALGLDLLPVQMYPKGGTLNVRLMQDAANYYEVRNTDGLGPGELVKVVGGQVVESAAFPSEYGQGTSYNMVIGFSPDLATVEAFGALLALTHDTTPITVNRIEIGAYQQDAYVDNIFYGDEIDRAPVADAGPDQAVHPGDQVTLDASGSFDLDGVITSYAWEQLDGPAIALSDASAPRPGFVAPLPSGTNVSMAFRVTVTDDAGQTASDTVWIAVWTSSDFTESFDTDTTPSYTLTTINPDRGSAQLVYDATGQRAQIVTANDVGLVAAQNLPPRGSGEFSLDFLPTQKYPKGASLAVRLMQDATNYIEVKNTDGYGPGSVTKVVNGQVVGVADFAGGYQQNVPYTIDIIFHPDLILVNAFGELVGIDRSQDSTGLSIGSFQLEAFQQDAYVDNITMRDAPPRSPIVFLTSPTGNRFQTDPSLHAEASAYDLGAGQGLRFTLNAGSASEVTVDDYSNPYAADFVDIGKGTFRIDLDVIDANHDVVPGDGLHDEAVDIAIGDDYVGVGDSITKGYGDDDPSDDVSIDGRNTGGGYEPILNDLLTAFEGYPNTVENEGVGGRTSAGGASKIASIVSAHPDAELFLVMFGTNDSSPDLATPSGLDLGPGDAGYAGSYKANMQLIIDTIVQAGALPVLAHVPIAYGDCSRCTPYPDPESEPRNALIREYNQVVDQLMLENGLTLAGPDFYTHFAQHPEEMHDRLHPNGAGYQSMANLWSATLTAP